MAVVQTCKPVVQPRGGAEAPSESQACGRTVCSLKSTVFCPFGSTAAAQEEERVAAFLKEEGWAGSSASRDAARVLPRNQQDEPIQVPGSSTLAAA